jgi:hypothetical protein
MMMMMMVMIMVVVVVVVVGTLAVSDKCTSWFSRGGCKVR